MKHIDGKIELDCFSIGDKKQLERELEKVFTSDTEVYFTQQWGFCKSDGIFGKTPKDPLTVYIRFGLEYLGEKPTFSFSIRDLWDDMFQGVSGQEGIDDKKHIKDARKLAKALRELADEIDVNIRK
jgi:hypothetical protein